MENDHYKVIVKNRQGDEVETLTLCRYETGQLLRSALKNSGLPEYSTAAIYDATGELVGEILDGTNTSLPDEYRHGWYNSKDFEL